MPPGRSNEGAVTMGTAGRWARWVLPGSTTPSTCSRHRVSLFPFSQRARLRSHRRAAWKALHSSRRSPPGCPPPAHNSSFAVCAARKLRELQAGCPAHQQLVQRDYHGGAWDAPAKARHNEGHGISGVGRWPTGSVAGPRAAACHSWLTAAARLCRALWTVGRSWKSAGREGSRCSVTPGFPLGDPGLCQHVQDVNQVPHYLQWPAADQLAITRLRAESACWCLRRLGVGQQWVAP